MGGFWNPQGGGKGGFGVTDPTTPGKAPYANNAVQPPPSAGSATMPGPAAYPGGANQATITGNPNSYNPAQTPGGNNYTPDPNIAAILQSRVGNPADNQALWNLGVQRDYSSPVPNANRTATAPVSTPAPISPPTYTAPSVVPPSNPVSSSVESPVAAPVMGNASQPAPSAAPTSPQAYQPSQLETTQQKAAPAVSPVIPRPIFAPGVAPAAPGSPIVNAMMRRYKPEFW